MRRRLERRRKCRIRAEVALLGLVLIVSFVVPKPPDYVKPTDEVWLAYCCRYRSSEADCEFLDPSRAPFWLESAYACYS